MTLSQCEPLPMQVRAPVNPALVLVVKYEFIDRFEVKMTNWMVLGFSIHKVSY